MASLNVSEWCIRTLQRITSDLLRSQDGRVLSGCQVQLELVFREVAASEILHHDPDNGSVAFDLIREALAIIEMEIQQMEGEPQRYYEASVMSEGTLGRPRFIIPRNQLAFLLEAQFSVPRIADILGVSVRTVRRRMSEYDLSVRMFYTNISDEELDHVVAEIQQEFPTCGNRQMQGHLLRREIRVQQHRVRESQRRVDPAGSIMRQLQIIHRRRYHVNGPQALWHIDGNHKLIR